MLGLGIYSSLWWYARHQPPPVQGEMGGTSRRTNILVTDGTTTDVLNTLTFSGISSLNGQVMLQTNPFRLGATNGLFRWNAGSSSLQYSNDGGSSWADIGSGTGNAAHALHAPSHSYIMAQYAHNNTFSFVNASTLQLAAYANFSSLGTAENILHVIETGYACSVLSFGKNATNKLWLVQGTMYDDTCLYNLYTSSQALTTTHRQRWAEYAVKVQVGGNVVFYVDGAVFGSAQAMSGRIFPSVANQTIYLYEGWGGQGGPIQIGTHPTWPDTGYKGISWERALFPARAFALPLAEGSGTTTTETINAFPFTLDSHVDWRDVDAW